jgi:hypothetical protein
MFKPSEAKSVEEYLNLIDEPRKSEIVKLHEFIQKTVPSLKSYFAYNMIGYGEFHYKSKSGREGDWPVISLASQKNYISVYVCAVQDGKYIAESHKKDFPKASIGKSCIRFKKIEDIDLKILGEVLKQAAKKPGFD